MLFVWGCIGLIQVNNNINNNNVDDDDDDDHHHHHHHHHHDFISVALFSMLNMFNCAEQYK